MPTDTPEARELALAAILPASTDRYIALFLGNPIAGGVELSLTGYARVAHQDWATTHPMTGESVRSNTSAITFPTVTDPGDCDYWAIYDADVGGTLLRFGQVLDDLGQPFTVNFTGGGDEAQFNIDALRIKMRDE